MVLQRRTSRSGPNASTPQESTKPERRPIHTQEEVPAMNTFDELGIVPPAPGQNRNAHWRVSLLTDTGSVITHLFNDEPEHRAVETLVHHHRANGAMIAPPTRVTEAA
jgi:hypothetical protein